MTLRAYAPCGCLRSELGLPTRCDERAWGEQMASRGWRVALEEDEPPAPPRCADWPRCYGMREAQMTMTELLAAG